MPKLRSVDVAKWPEAVALFDRLGVSLDGCRRVQLTLDVDDCVSVTTNRIGLEDKSGVVTHRQCYRTFAADGSDITELNCND